MEAGLTFDDEKPSPGADVADAFHVAQDAGGWVGPADRCGVRTNQYIGRGDRMTEPMRHTPMRPEKAFEMIDPE